MATIKLSNSVLIDSSSLKMGIDMSNLIASNITSFPYTATQNCWAICSQSGDNSGCSWKINDINFTEPVGRVCIPIFLKTGQALNCYSNSSTYKSIRTIFGTK